MIVMSLRNCISEIIGIWTKNSFLENNRCHISRCRIWRQEVLITTCNCISYLVTIQRAGGGGGGVSNNYAVFVPIDHAKSNTARESTLTMLNQIMFAMHHWLCYIRHCSRCTSAKNILLTMWENIAPVQVTFCFAPGAGDDNLMYTKTKLQTAFGTGD